MSELSGKRCVPMAKGTPAMDVKDAKRLLAELDGWEINDDASAISRTFRFRDYYQTIAFVNALAWIVHQEDHHPDLEVGYNRCRVCFSTHSVGGLSDNDFICAARIDLLPVEG